MDSSLVIAFLIIFNLIWTLWLSLTMKDVGKELDRLETKVINEHEFNFKSRGSIYRRLVALDRELGLEWKDEHIEGYQKKDNVKHTNK